MMTKTQRRSLISADFTQQDLREVSFTSTDLREADFSFAVLTSSEFVNANLLKATFGLEVIVRAHSNAVCSASFSADGGYLASAGADSLIKVWELRTGLLVQTLQGHSGGVRTVCYSNSSSLIGSGGLDCLIKLWESLSGTLLQTLSYHVTLVLAVCFSPNDQFLLSGGPTSEICVWSVEDGIVDRSIKVPAAQEIRTLAFCNHSSFLVCTTRRGFVSVIDFQTGQELNRFARQAAAIYSVCVSPDGNTLACGTADCDVILWETGSGRCLKKLEGHTFPVWSLAFSTDGSKLASASSDGIAIIWNMLYDCQLMTYQHHTRSVRWIQFSPIEQLIASAGDDCMLFFVKVPDCPTQPMVTPSLCSLGLSEDGSLLAVGYIDGRVDVIATESMTLLKTLTWHKCDIQTLNFSQDNALLASSEAEEDILIVWNIGTGEPTLVLANEDGCFYGTFSPNSQYIATGGTSPGVKIWDLGSRTFTEPLELGSGYVSALAYSSNGVFLCSAYTAGACLLWDISKNELVWRIMFEQAAYELRYSGDTLSLIVLCHGNTLARIAASTGTIEILCTCPLSVRGVATSKAGQNVYIVGTDPALAIYSLVRRELLGVLSCFNCIACCTSVPNGTLWWASATRRGFHVHTGAYK